MQASTQKASNKKPLAVIKVGGDLLLNPKDRKGFAKNVAALVDIGWSVVVLHGGGPQLNTLQQVHGLKPHKIDGRRVTSRDDLRVVKQALCGEVNVDLVSACIAQGLPALGLHGASAKLIQARKRAKMHIEGRGRVDFGEVGDVKKINTRLLNLLLEDGFVPVIASLGVSKKGRVFNINADTTVAAIASAMQADMLVLSTEVGAVFADIKDQQSRFEKLTPKRAEQLIALNIIKDGMIPKLRESFALLEQGVDQIVICNAAKKGALLDLAQNQSAFGTRLLPD